MTDRAAISRILFYFDHNHQHAVLFKETIKHCFTRKDYRVRKASLHPYQKIFKLKSENIQIDQKINIIDINYKSLKFKGQEGLRQGCIMGNVGSKRFEHNILVSAAFLKQSPVTPQTNK